MAAERNSLPSSSICTIWRSISSIATKIPHDRSDVTQKRQDRNPFARDKRARPILQPQVMLARDERNRLHRPIAGNDVVMILRARPNPFGMPAFAKGVGDEQHRVGACVGDELDTV